MGCAIAARGVDSDQLCAGHVSLLVEIDFVFEEQFAILGLCALLFAETVEGRYHRVWVCEVAVAIGAACGVPFGGVFRVGVFVGKAAVVDAKPWCGCEHLQFWHVIVLFNDLSWFDLSQLVGHMALLDSAHSRVTFSNVNHHRIVE